MAVWECTKCGELYEGRCKPKKCKACGEAGTLTRKDAPVKGKQA